MDKQFFIKKKTVIHNGFFFNYFLEQHDFFSVEAVVFLSDAFLSEQQDFSVFSFFFSFSFSLKFTTVAEETINAIKATIDNTFFMIFIFNCYINYIIYFKINNLLLIK
jgi:hypothetical protein